MLLLVNILTAPRKSSIWPVSSGGLLLLAGGLLAPGVVVGFAGLAVAMPRTPRPGAGTIGIDLLLAHFRSLVVL